MEKVKKYVGIVTILLLVLTTGVLIGSKLENFRQDNINGNLYNINKVAVVNLDEGVTINQNEHKNYAKELLDNYSEIYILTGLSDAQAGISEGRYAAYVIIPSDFSSNFVSVNSIPQKNLLKYEISGSLSQNATDTAWMNVMQLKESINDDIGYVYISAVLGEFHDGQNNATKVLANDSKDKEVLMAISNFDLVATLDLKEVERLQNNIENLDINPDININKEIINSIDTAYKSYLNLSSQQLSEIQRLSAILNKDNANIQKSSERIKNLSNDDDSKNYSTNTTENILHMYNMDLSTKLNEILENIMNSSNHQNTLKDTYITNRKNDINSLVNELQVSHVKLTSDQWKSFKKNLNTILDDALKTFAIDWVDYPSITAILDEEKNNKKINGAINYIDKVILHQFSVIDFSMPIIDFDDLIMDITTNLPADDKLDSYLEMYAKYIGKTDEEAKRYTLKDYIDDNKNITNKLPAVEPTDDSDALKAKFKIAMRTDIKRKLKNHTSNLQKDINTLIDAQTSSDIKTDNQSSIDDYEKSLEDVPSYEVDDINKLVKNIVSINISSIKTSIEQDLSSLTEEQKKNKQQLLNDVNNHNLLNIAFHDSLLLYDPLKNINNQEISSFVKKYEINNSNTKHKIENKNREYVTFVSDSYTNANDQVKSMKEDVLKYQAQSDKMVTNGLENAKKVRNETSSGNTELMISLINKLPYTRNGTVANHRVYDFMMTASNMEGYKNTYSITESYFDLSKLFISVSSICIIGCGAIFVFTKFKGRQIHKK